MADLIQTAALASLLAIELAMEAASSGDSAVFKGASLSGALATPDDAEGTPLLRPESSLSVKINGRALAADDLEAVAEVKIKDDVEAPSSVTLRFTGDDALKRADQGLYDPGSPLVVGLGYGVTSPVFDGEITGLELELGGDGIPTLSVCGYDLRHRLLRGTRTAAYAGMTDSAIAKQIADKNELGWGGSTTTLQYDYVLQHAQSDLAFLKQRAARIGYEVVVEGRVLSFRPHRLSDEGVITLSMNDQVTELYARMSAVGQPQKMLVRGWDPKAKAAIAQEVLSSSLVDMGGTDGGTLATRKFPTSLATVTSAEQPVSSADEAQTIARGELQEVALGFVRGELTCVGDTRLKAGIAVELTDLGSRFGGRYHVASAEHSYTRDQGYRTMLAIRKSAVGTSGAGLGEIEGQA
jgi:phage protein D